MRDRTLAPQALELLAQGLQQRRVRARRAAAFAAGWRPAQLRARQFQHTGALALPAQFHPQVRHLRQWLRTECQRRIARPPLAPRCAGVAPSATGLRTCDASPAEGAGARAVDTLDRLIVRLVSQELGKLARGSWAACGPLI